ncbi:S66 peptidase family protein [Kitasatospora cinereorecta]|uniref:S66 peptidase family protein n=1 Tax=Kitasatospora cinereorecta TaxID=285560 RepID=A0ABW0VJ46_9ACTN
MIEPAYPAKPSPGDRVAIVSPAAGLPELYPLPYELGLRRLTEDFGVVPVEYPTTRKMGTSPQERAADLHAAFADPEIKAVIASIGGSDQITVIPHLDAELIRANPKPFFGYSDNTNLLDFLWRQGIVGFHGGGVMTQYGRPGAMDPMSESSIRAALFTSGPYELTEPARITEVNRDWADPATFDAEPATEPATGWSWHRADRVVEGRSWGGCLDIVAWLMMADRIAPPETYEGCVLFLETSERLMSADEVYFTLRCMGERGLLRRFSALLMGRAMAWSFQKPLGPAERERHRAEQRAAVLRALAEYAPDTMAVFDVDLGHTEPQQIVPYGGVVRVDGPARRVTVHY